MSERRTKKGIPSAGSRAARPLYALAFSLGLTSLVALHACSGGGDSSTSGTTTSSTATAGAGGTTTTTTTNGQGGSPPDASVIHCKKDDGSDPVNLCAQKVVLLGVHTAGFSAEKGVAQSWDEKTGLPDKGPDGKALHDPRDDARYAAAIARYHESAQEYGDTEATPVLDADLLALVPLLQAEFASPPKTYDGEIYMDLRVAAGGLRYLNEDDSAAKLDAIADTYGRAIFADHFVALAGQDGVLGAPMGQGAAAYAPADVATGALALCDLAVRHAKDEPASSAKWQAAAAASIDHLWSRARHASGLLYGSLVTSADPDHDALAKPDAPLLTDVQATAALAILRMQELVNKNPDALKPIASAPFEDRGEALIAALEGMNGAIWDSVSGGYLEGVDVTTLTPLPGKTTRSGALLFAAVRRAVLGGNSPYGNRLKALRSVLADRMPPNSGLLSVVPDQSGYFARVPKDFNFMSEDAGPGPQERSYWTSADCIAIEGLTEGWFGLPQ
jgi:hypothetical protein